MYDINDYLHSHIFCSNQVLIFYSNVFKHIFKYLRYVIISAPNLVKSHYRNCDYDMQKIGGKRLLSDGVMLCLN